MASSACDYVITIIIFNCVFTDQAGMVVPTRPGGQLEPLLEVLRHELVRHHVEQHAKQEFCDIARIYYCI
jgi:hypothetical protein